MDKYCDQIMFVVNGSICCVMNPDEIKEKLGQGFTCIVKLDLDLDFEHYSQLKSRISNEFPSSFLQREEPVSVICIIQLISV